MESTSPSAIPQNSSQPSLEWKPPSATSGEKRTPTQIKTTIRSAFASQTVTTAIGKSRYALGKRSSLRLVNRWRLVKTSARPMPS